MMMFSAPYDYGTRSWSQSPARPVEVAQMYWEISKLLLVYRELKPTRVLEIGVQFGGTLHKWLSNAQPGSMIMGIDHWKRTEMPTDPRPTWESWVPDGVNFYPIIGDSHDSDTLARVLSITSELDFLFIDGDHTEEGATTDWEMYGPLVRRGGVIALHDLITPDRSPHIGVPKLWRRIQRAGYLTRELYAQPPGQLWGGIGIVFV